MSARPVGASALLWALAALSSSCGSSQTAAGTNENAPPDEAAQEPAQAPAGSDEPLVLDPATLAIDIRVRGGMPRPLPPGEPSTTPVPRIAVAIRGDGQALFSAAEDGAGPPFRRGQVDVARLRAWLTERRAAGTFDDANLRYSRVGPDAPCWAIALRAGDLELTTCSWHFRAASTTTVVTANGIEVLAGRDRAAVLAAQPDDFQRYVRDFEAIVRDARAMLPPGEPVPDAEAATAARLGQPAHPD